MNCIIIADKPYKGRKTKGWNGLAQVNKKETLVENQLRVISNKFPKSKIIYVYGFDAKKASNYFHQLNKKNVVGIYNHEFDTFGEINSFRHVIEYLNQDCLILTGNIVLKPSMFDNFTKSKSRSKIFINTKQENELGCVLNEEQNIQNICYGLENYLIGMYYISSADITLFKQIINNYLCRNHFLFETINKMIDQHVTFSPIISSRKIHSQSIKDLQEQ